MTQQMTPKPTGNAAPPKPSRIGLWTGLVILALGIGIIGFISTFKKNPSSLANPDDPVQVALGGQAYQASCAACHGATLTGQKNWRKANVMPRPAPPLDSSGPAWQKPDRALYAVLTAPDHVGDTPPDEQTAWAILAFLKSSWGHKERQSQLERTMRDQTSQ